MSRRQAVVKFGNWVLSQLETPFKPNATPGAFTGPNWGNTFAQVSALFQGFKTGLPNDTGNAPAVLSGVNPAAATAIPNVLGLQLNGAPVFASDSIPAALTKLLLAPLALAIERYRHGNDRTMGSWAKTLDDLQDKIVNDFKNGSGAFLAQGIPLDRAEKAARNYLKTSVKLMDSFVFTGKTGERCNLAAKSCFKGDTEKLGSLFGPDGKKSRSRKRSRSRSCARKSFCSSKSRSRSRSSSRKRSSKRRSYKRTHY